jgi:hypothetical protein
LVVRCCDPRDGSGHLYLRLLSKFSSIPYVVFYPPCLVCIRVLRSSESFTDLSLLLSAGFRSFLSPVLSRQPPLKSIYYNSYMPRFLSPIIYVVLLRCCSRCPVSAFSNVFLEQLVSLFALPYFLVISALSNTPLVAQAKSLYPYSYFVSRPSFYVLCCPARLDLGCERHQCAFIIPLLNNLLYYGLTVTPLRTGIVTIDNLQPAG